MRHAARGSRRLRQSGNASDLAHFVACTRHAAMRCGVLTHQQPQLQQQQQLQQQRRCPTSLTSLSRSCLSVLFRLLACCCCCCCLHATELNASTCTIRRKTIRGEYRGCQSGVEVENCEEGCRSNIGVRSGSSLITPRLLLTLKFEIWCILAG